MIGSSLQYFMLVLVDHLMQQRTKEQVVVLERALGEYDLSHLLRSGVVLEEAVRIAGAR